MNYHLIISDKQKELTKVVKDAIGIGFQKGYLASHSLEYSMFEGSFSAEIKDKVKGEVIFDTGFMEMNPRAIYTLNFGKICKELDENIKKVKEFISLVKKLK
jgi:hypothetical protein